MPQNSFDPNQPITIATVWPYLLGMIGTIFVFVRRMVLRLVQLEFKTPLTDIKSELKVLAEKIEKSHNSSIELKIIVARLDERIESIQNRRE